MDSRHGRQRASRALRQKQLAVLAREGAKVSTYEIKCEAGKHVYSFTAAELKEKFGPTRANERMEDPEYPLVVKSCEECLEADEKPRPGGLNYLRARYGVPA